MTADDWKRVLDQAAAGGTKTVQFIGGEPTLHPQFGEFVEHALDNGLRVQVFSNLYRVRCKHWALFSHPQVSPGGSFPTPGSLAGV
ncbi:radical SAM protein [Streptomyces sp. NPDC059629]|uniref:radical SAM protein n=1 Tax=Streptomyces sp. NPDC059629 TaxID=3346889 RepID=UPI003696ADCA